ncbi:hypothetical protein GCM10022215_21630 [Nocardioides fonticola]|uniref:Uncharacterized protein n=1 Tax=Nocardioides fonticola TaxID=450363 RepID=A0ABP7XIZ6_9ACTN
MSGDVLTTRRSEPVREGETLHVGDGGLVEAEGGRLFVGSGGLVRVTGPARVTLIDDGHGLLDGRAPARALLLDGDLAADGGEAWTAPIVGWQLRGTATVTPLAGPSATPSAPSPRRTVAEGRLVQVRPVDARDPDVIWESLLATARPPRPDALPLPAEPVDLTAWSGPILEALRSAGGRPRGRAVETADRVDVEVRCSDPRAALLQVAGALALPPGIVVVQGSDGWSLLADAGLRIRVA